MGHASTARVSTSKPQPLTLVRSPEVRATKLVRLGDGREILAWADVEIGAPRPGRPRSSLCVCDCAECKRTGPGHLCEHRGQACRCTCAECVERGPGHLCSALHRSCSRAHYDEADVHWRDLGDAVDPVVWERGRVRPDEDREDDELAGLAKADSP